MLGTPTQITNLMSLGTPHPPCLCVLIIKQPHMTVTDQGGPVKCVETQKIVQANLEGIQWRGGTQTDTHKGPHSTLCT
jgi:hypothetical protein